MRIVIVDDHVLFTEGLKNLLESRGYDIIGLARDGLEALELAETLQPDIMLIDISMPKCDGLEATILIKANCPYIKIVILTSSESEEDIFKAIKYGACGYFIKSFSADILFKLLDDLAKDEVTVFPELAHKILEEFQREKKEAGKMQLTKRQYQILMLIKEGYYYKEIGKKLGISERTVKYHVGSAINNLHFQNRQQLINYVTKMDL